MLPGSFVHNYMYFKYVYFADDQVSDMTAKANNKLQMAVLLQYYSHFCKFQTDLDLLLEHFTLSE